MTQENIYELTTKLFEKVKEIPISTEREYAIKSLEEFMFWSQKAIARPNKFPSTYISEGGNEIQLSD